MAPTPYVQRPFDPTGGIYTSPPVSSPTPSNNGTTYYTDSNGDRVARTGPMKEAPTRYSPADPASYHPPVSNPYSAPSQPAPQSNNNVTDNPQNISNLNNTTPTNYNPQNPSNYQPTSGTLNVGGNVTFSAGQMGTQGTSQNNLSNSPLVRPSVSALDFSEGVTNKPTYRTSNSNSTPSKKLAMITGDSTSPDIIINNGVPLSKQPTTGTLVGSSQPAIVRLTNPEYFKSPDYLVTEKKAAEIDKHNQEILDQRLFADLTPTQKFGYGATKVLNPFTLVGDTFDTLSGNYGTNKLNPSQQGVVNDIRNSNNKSGFSTFKDVTLNSELFGVTEDVALGYGIGALGSTALATTTGAKVGSSIIGKTAILGTGLGIVGVTGYNDYQAIKTDINNQEYGKAAKETSKDITGAVAFGVGANAGFKRGGFQFFGKEQVPVESVVEPKVLSGENTFPNYPSGKTTAIPKSQLNTVNQNLVGEFQNSPYKLNEGTQSGYHATGDTGFRNAESVSTSEPTRPTDAPGLYIAPSLSKNFLRVSNSESGQVIDKPLTQRIKDAFFGIGSFPSAVNVEVGGFERLPQSARGSIQTGNEFLYGKAEGGKAYITPAREVYGKPEAEAVVTPGSSLTNKNSKSGFGFNKYVTVDNTKVPIYEFQAGEKVRVKRGYLDKSNNPDSLIKQTESYRNSPVKDSYLPDSSFVLSSKNDISSGVTSSLPSSSKLSSSSFSSSSLGSPSSPSSSSPSSSSKLNPSSSYPSSDISTLGSSPKYNSPPSSSPFSSSSKYGSSSSLPGSSYYPKSKPSIPPLPGGFNGTKLLPKLPGTKSNRNFGYAPSLFAKEFNIRAPKGFKKNKTYSGLEIRPLV